MGYTGRYQKDPDSDRHGRTKAGRARDRAGDRDSDHGAPHEAGGKRANHRAGHVQVVKTTWYGTTKVVRGGKEGDLRDRWNR